MKVWIFGDSFGERFSDFDFKAYDDIDYRVRYYKWKGYSPLSYGEIISQELGFDLEIVASSGSSNIEIFHSFISKMDEIKDGDIVVVNWTFLNRFRIASENNTFEKVMVNAGCESPNKFVSMKTLEEIAINRDSYTIYYKEVLDYTKVIKKICGDNIYTFIWTFMINSKEDTDLDVNLQDFYNEVKSISHLEKISQETLGVIADGHYSEYGHQQLANEILNNIKLWTTTTK